MKKPFVILSLSLLIGATLGCEPQSVEENSMQNMENTSEVTTENTYVKSSKSSRIKKEEPAMDFAQQIPGKIGHLDGKELAVFTMDDKIIVINSNGVAYAHHIGESIGEGIRISNVPLGVGGAPAKFIFPLRDQILVVNQDREIWRHGTDKLGMSFAKMVPFHPTQGKIVWNEEDYVFPLGNRIMMINKSGGVYASEFSEDYQVGEKYRVWGSPMGLDNGDVRIRALIPYNNSVIAVNNMGEVWAVDFLSETTYGRPYILNGLHGPSVGVYGEPAAHFLAHDEKILVINVKGEVWAYQIHR